MKNSSQIDLAAIHPAKSPMYSRNFHRFLKKERVQRDYGSLWVDSKGGMHFGWEDENSDFIGAFLPQVLCGSLKTFCFPGLPKGAKKVENWFEQYLAKGVCLFDPEHKWYPGRWKALPEIGYGTAEVRVCGWCGLCQRKKTYAVTVVRERWLTIKSWRAKAAVRPEVVV